MEKMLKFSVDEQALESAAQFLTGAVIKEMSGTPLDYDLYLVVPGFEDELIKNDMQVNLARPGVERFVTRRHGSGITILVNGVPHSHSNPATSITYEQVVKYAFPNAAFSADRGYSVTYYDGPARNEEGILVKGASVSTKSHMRFNVTATHKS